MTDLQGTVYKPNPNVSLDDMCEDMITELWKAGDKAIEAGMPESDRGIFNAKAILSLSDKIHAE